MRFTGTLAGIFVFTAAPGSAIPMLGGPWGGRNPKPKPKNSPSVCHCRKTTCGNPRKFAARAKSFWDPRKWVDRSGESATMLGAEVRGGHISGPGAGTVTVGRTLENRLRSGNMLARDSNSADMVSSRPYLFPSDRRRVGDDFLARWGIQRDSIKSERTRG